MDKLKHAAGIRCRQNRFGCVTGLYAGVAIGIFFQGKICRSEAMRELRNLFIFTNPAVFKKDALVETKLRNFMQKIMRIAIPATCAE